MIVRDTGRREPTISSDAHALSDLTREESLSLVVPALDESENLPVYLPQVFAALAATGLQHELLVVDDGSRDGTGEIARALGARVIRHAARRGYGAAVRSGLAAARGRIVGYIDGDGQYDVGELPALLSPVLAGQADLVAGIRSNRADRPHRRVIGASYNAFMRRLTHTSLTDMDCGFKVLRREVVQGLSLQCDGNLFGVELLAKATRAGFRVRQVAVTHRPRVRGEAKGVDPFALANAAVELVRWWAELRP